ncbi:MAG: hypothetical protein HYS12_22130 [Planctomycetes bacterium]|nr:hypothetical protein [Planctomycetota bacterium]
MRRGTRLAWLLAAVGACAIGCKGSGPRKKGPEDPLLQSKTAVQSKFADPNEVTARADPSPPTIPAGAWSAGRGQFAFPVRLGPPDFNIPPGQASLAWSTDKPAVSAAGPYARSADSRWLQGVLERTPDNRWLLRYEPMSRDSGAGKVFVEGHERLDLFEPGDVIRVEGALVEEPQGGSERLPHPRYRVRHVELIQRHS